jgi:hypothetical protein
LHTRRHCTYPTGFLEAEDYWYRVNFLELDKDKYSGLENGILKLVLFKYGQKAKEIIDNKYIWTYIFSDSRVDFGILSRLRV